MAISFNTPSGVRVPAEHNWLATNSAYSLIMPQIAPTEAKPWGDQDMTGFMELMGGEKTVSGISYRHFEEDRIHQLVIADYTSGSTGSANDTITYTVDSTDIIASYPATAQEPYVATGTQVNLMPVRVGEVLLFPNGAQGIVTTVTASSSQFTCVSTNGIAQGSSLTAADTVINLGVTVGEGKDQPATFNFRENVYYNMMEIMNDSYSSTGTALGEKTWVDYTYNGQTKAVWWFKGQGSTLKRFRNFREMKIMTGNKVVSATGINAYDATLTRTEGVIPFASSYNSTNTFNLLSGLTLGDYQTILIDQIDKNAGSPEIANWTAISNRAAMEDFIRVEMKNGGVQYGAFSGGQKQAVDFGFDSFQTLGYTSHMMTYQPFNNPTLLGAAGHTYSNLSLLIPMAKEAYAMGEKKTKVDVPSMMINYNENAGFARKMEEWLTGGTGGVYTNTVDTIQINFRSHCGFEGFGANRFATLQGSNS